ncbi:MAG: hypothetical protein WDN08_01555 [Rhizomicrobium sp.]
MSKMIQLRNVPDAVHRRLKACAASEGMSLSDFLTREVRKVAERLTMEEMRHRWANQPVQHLKVSPTEILREERDSR